jgi:hypothetical protein
MGRLLDPVDHFHDEAFPKTCTMSPRLARGVDQRNGWVVAAHAPARLRTGIVHAGGFFLIDRFSEHVLTVWDRFPA